jgi:hypothetical protein
MTSQTFSFNYFADNQTCQTIPTFVDTVPCSGLMGYPHKDPSGSNRELARRCPSAVWTFPRAGSDPRTTYTKDDVLLSTPSKNYTAFDVDQLLVMLLL